MSDKIRQTLLFLLFSVFPLAATADDPSDKELVFLNWSEYMDPALIEAFEARHGVRVREVFYESDDDRDEMMLANEGRGFDLILVSGLRLDSYRRRGWLAPLDPQAIPNLKHIEERWLSAFDAKDYGVPYFWGTLGIAYRQDLVPEPITRWQQLFQPHDSLKDRIVMIDANRDLVGMALKSLGYSANSTDAQHLAEAEALLMAQKPYVRHYSYDTLTEDSALVTGQIAAGMMYSGDALMVREHNSDIRYVLPEEGGNIWVDYLAVTASSRHPDLAMAFIDFLNEPAHAAQLARFVYYPTPNRAAEALLPADFLADPFIYPNREKLARSEFYKPLPPRALRKYNRIGLQVRR